VSLSESGSIIQKSASGGATDKQTSEINLKKEEEARINTEQLLQQQTENAGRSCCLSGSTLIVMGDGSWKEVQYIKPGDLVLDMQGNSSRVIILGKTFLGSRTLHGFAGFGQAFFTSEHQFVGPDKSLRLCVDPSALKKENPLMELEKIEAISKNGKILYLDSQENDHNPKLKCLNAVQITRVVLSPAYPVYFLELAGDGTYFANGFVARHELPNFTLWPDLGACLWMTFHSVSAALLSQYPAMISSITDHNQILGLARKVSASWKTAIPDDDDYYFGESLTNDLKKVFPSGDLLKRFRQLETNNWLTELPPFDMLYTFAWILYLEVGKKVQEFLEKLDEERKLAWIVNFSSLALRSVTTNNDVRQ